MQTHKTVARDEWMAARRELLAKEKELLHATDAVKRQARELPWVKVDKAYVFDGPNGRETLSDLFDGRSQLVVKHFMLGPGWQEGCVGCSFGADHIGGTLAHLEHHDVTSVVISRAPLAEIEAFRQRMGWQFKWVSSYGNNFNFDHHVSFTPDQLAGGKVYYNYAMCELGIDEMPGVSVFYRDAAGGAFHTYSTYSPATERHARTH